MAVKSKTQVLEDKLEKAAAEPKAAKKTPPPIKLPKTLAACADLYNALRTARLAKSGEADELEEQEKFVKAYLIDMLPKSEATGVAGKTCRVAVVEKSIPQVKDWDSFYKYILKTKDFSLLNRAANKKAIEERWDAKKVVPGVEAFKTKSLSLSQVK